MQIRNNKGPSTEPWGTPYFIYWDILFAIGKVGTKPIIGKSSYTIVFKFIEENWVIYCVKRLCKVHKNTTCKATFIKGKSYQLSKAGQGMLGWMFGPETKLKLIYAIM